MVTRAVGGTVYALAQTEWWHMMAEPPAHPQDCCRRHESAKNDCKRMFALLALLNSGVKTHPLATNECEPWVVNCAYIPEGGGNAPNSCLLTTKKHQKKQACLQTHQMMQQDEVLDRFYITSLCFWGIYYSNQSATRWVFYLFIHFNNDKFLKMIIFFLRLWEVELQEDLQETVKAGLKHFLGGQAAGHFNCVY